MLEKIAGLNLKELTRLPLFITVTYPADWPEDPKQVKAHLRALRARIERRWPQQAGPWKIEPQERGAPHIHLLLYNIPFMPHQWLAQAWYEIVGSGDPKHLEAGTEVRRCKSVRQALHYAAKYLGKHAESPDTREWGRRWGIWNVRFLPLHLVVKHIASYPAYVLRRWLHAYQRSQGYRRRGRRGRYEGTAVWMSSGPFQRLEAAAIAAGRDVF